MRRYCPKSKSIFFYANDLYWLYAWCEGRSQTWEGCLQTYSGTVANRRGSQKSRSSSWQLVSKIEMRWDDILCFNTRTLSPSSSCVSSHRKLHDSRLAVAEQMMQTMNRMLILNHSSIFIHTHISLGQLHFLKIIMEMRESIIGFDNNLHARP